MSFNFDSAQFNRESTPRKLGNWQVPRWAPTRARDLQYRPDPKPVCDINGHFLPGAPRGTSRCFGHFTGTWELPSRITRAVAEKLQKEPPEGRFPDWLHLRVQRPKAAAAARKAARLRAAQRGQPTKKEEPEPDDEDSFLEVGNKAQNNIGKRTPVNTQQKTDENHNKQDNSEENHNNQDNSDEKDNEQDDLNENQNKNDADDPLALFNKKKPEDADGNAPYIPGSLTDPDKRHDSYDTLVKDAVEKIHGPQEDDRDKFWRKVAENAAKDEKARNENMKCKKTSETLKLPQVNVSQNFQFAKKMHVGNLEHQPLPDTLGYRNMTKIGEHRDSDIVVKPYAIGWKGYGASGPTCCTKMRVHRPKTCDQNKADGDKGDGMRPATSVPDLGGQYQKPMSLMDLAICWDFRPDDPKKEPRPPKHIDGSNGSKAPAVFTMVHTPKDDIEDHTIGTSQPIFNQNRLGEDMGRHPVPYFEKDMTKEKRKDSCDVQYCPQHSSGNEKMNSKNSSRGSSAQSVVLRPKCDGIHGCGTPSDQSRKSSREERRPDKLQPIKEAWNGNNHHGNNHNANNHNGNNNNKIYDMNRNRHSLESYEKTPLAQGKLHQSSPKESQGSRPSKDTSHTKHKNCLSCNGTKIPQEHKQKDDYKFAFKAGNPNSVQCNSNCSTDSKGVKIPKMRHPYTKKSYTIPTLAPPFSIWRDANATGYPEHWRLASVYQHAYKPMDQRRKPLISSVYQ